MAESCKFWAPAELSKQKPQPLGLLLMHIPALIFQDSQKEAEELLELQTNDWAAN